jgi:hypothetical protein
VHTPCRNIDQCHPCLCKEVTKNLSKSSEDFNSVRKLEYFLNREILQTIKLVCWGISTKAVGYFTYFLSKASLANSVKFGNRRVAAPYSAPGRRGILEMWGRYSFLLAFACSLQKLS